MTTPISALRDLTIMSCTSSSDLQSVLQTLLERAAELCHANTGAIHLTDDGRHSIAVIGAASAAKTDTAAAFVVESLMPRVLDVGQVHLVDALNDPIYVPTGPKLLGEIGTLLGVRLERDGECRGAMFLARSDVRGFSDEEIEIARLAAAKAAAIVDECRAADELRDVAKQQQATAEILRMLTKSSSDPTVLFGTLVERARVLCDADNATLAVFHGDRSRVAANAGQFIDEARYNAAWADLPARPDPATITGRILLTRAAVHLPDIDADRTLKRSVVPATGARSALAAPLLRDGEVTGVLVVRRRDLRPFAFRHMRLLETFADQAAIAIENARLLATATNQSRELARFLSPEVAKLVTSDEGERLLDAHRREITVMFCDLRGFSAFSEVTEPEEVLRVIRQYHATMGSLIVNYKGTLEHFAGDGMMVFFNDPVTIDSHERAAVRLAIAMQTAFSEIATAWRERGHELGLGIGIASGFATLGRIGFEGRYDYGAVGNVVIVASRLSVEAKSGQILITQRIHATLDQTTPTELVGRLELKGISRPVSAFAVTAVPG